MTKPAVVLIGADKAGVGKTTVARTLLDSISRLAKSRNGPPGPFLFAALARQC